MYTTQAYRILPTEEVSAILLLSQGEATLGNYALIFVAILVGVQYTRLQFLTELPQPQFWELPYFADTVTDTNFNFATTLVGTVVDAFKACTPVCSEGYEALLK
eukprot:4769257-Amphidinium_carterae.2